MKRTPGEVDLSIVELTAAEFLQSYNSNIPEAFPHVSLALLKKFKSAHESLFKRGDFWSLDAHRKKMIEWLPRNGIVSEPATK